MSAMDARSSSQYTGNSLPDSLETYVEDLHGPVSSFVQLAACRIWRNLCFPIWNGVELPPGACDWCFDLLCGLVDCLCGFFAGNAENPKTSSCTGCCLNLNVDSLS